MLSPMNNEIRSVHALSIIGLLVTLEVTRK